MTTIPRFNVREEIEELASPGLLIPVAGAIILADAIWIQGSMIF